MAKGDVRVHNDKGWLRLVWSCYGKRHWLSLGLPDSRTNRKVAELKAAEIQKDILYERFDSTLTKYRPGHQPKSEQPDTESPAIADLFEKFTTAQS